MLIDTLKADLLSCRKAKTDQIAINLLTTLVGEADRIGFDDGKRKTEDTEVVATINKFVKNLNLVIKSANDAGLNTDKECREIEILYQYLPKQLDEAQLTLIIDNIIASGANTKSEVMRKLKEGYAGKFNGAQASALAEKILG